VTDATVVGVDFSGAARAGRATWIAQARDDGERLHIEDLRCAADLPGGALDREPAHRALVAWLLDIRPALVGFDFPFGMPRDLVAQNDWRSWLEAFAGAHGSAEAFREDCRVRAAGKEWKRRTDREARTPMCVYNLRLYRQTWHGLRDVVAPLVRAGARAMPMEAGAASSGDTLLVETCPASLLKSSGMPTVYKGRTAAHAEARRRIVGWMASARGVSWGSRRLRALAIDDPGGDALDAALCASSGAAALRVGLDAFRRDALDEDYRLEARVYCG
jgi:hypothetical protein